MPAEPLSRRPPQLLIDLGLVTIGAGPFRMGSDDGPPDERPVHDVWLAEFAIAALPVTNRDYRRFVAETGRAAAPLSLRPGFDLPLQPVVAVNWFDAVAYCEWLRAVTGLPCRLPTEAEREKAARGGVDRRRYPWGDGLPAASDQRLVAPPAIGHGAANGFGLFHMADLVHEWCSDWYAADGYRDAASRDPRGPAHGVRRCSRGGSWRHLVPVTRCAARSSLPPDRRYSDYGFRVAVGGDAGPAVHRGATPPADPP